MRNRHAIYNYYLEKLMSKILQQAPEMLNALNETIDQYNQEQLTFQQLTTTVYDNYRSYVETDTGYKKPILFCIDTLNGGGAEKLLIDILNRFDHDKYKVDLLVMDAHGVYFDKIPESVDWFIGDELIRDKEYAFEIAFLEGAAVKYVAGSKRQSSKIAWIHIDLYTFHWIKHFYNNQEEERQCFDSFDKLVFVSEDVKLKFNKLLTGLDEEKQTVILNMIDKNTILNRASEFDVTRKCFTFCSLGRLNPVKGYDRLIPILSKLMKEGFQFEFWILGDGYQRDELQQMAKDYSLQGVVQFLGFQPNPYPYMAHADVFVAASFAEGYSLAICEAVCLGKPVLATDTSGVKEILDNEYEFIVEQDETLLYEALKRIMVDSTLRQRLSDYCKLRSQKFDPNVTMEQIYNLISNSSKLVNGCAS